MTEQQTDAAIEAFEIALEEYTAYEVDQAARKWLQHKDGEGTENYSYAPSAPQMARLCDKVRYEFKGRPSKYETLNAPDAPPPPTEDEKNRVQALVDNLKANKRQPTRQPEQQIPIPEQKVLDEIHDKADGLRKSQWEALQPNLERKAVESLMNREGRKGNEWTNDLKTKG